MLFVSQLTHITKLANIDNNGDRGVEFGSSGVGEHAEHNGVDFVGIFSTLQRMSNFSLESTN